LSAVRHTREGPSIGSVAIVKPLMSQDRVEEVDLVHRTCSTAQ